MITKKTLAIFAIAIVAGIGTIVVADNTIFASSHASPSACTHLTPGINHVLAHNPNCR